MTCQEALQFLEPALEKTLDDHSSTDFRQHLHECPKCSSEYSQAMAFVAWLDGLPEPEPPVGLLDEIKVGVRSEAARLTLARRLGWAGSVGLPLLFAAFVYFFFPGGFAGFWRDSSMLATSWYRAALEFVTGSGQEGLIGRFKGILPPTLAEYWQATLFGMVLVLLVGGAWLVQRYRRTGAWGRSRV
jgi:hypothetical protein